MFVRCKKRFKDGKEHRYWSVVENVRVGGGRVAQRQVLYLGEINDSQRAAWCRSIEVLEGASHSRQVALFPEDREAPELECEVVQVRLAELTASTAPEIAEATRAEASVLRLRSARSRSLRVEPTVGGPITENQCLIISSSAELAKSV